jgi:hypothetical protein
VLPHKRLHRARARPSTWRAKTASRWITKRCGGGCWRPACGVGPGSAGGIVGSCAQGACRRAGPNERQFSPVVGDARPHELFADAGRRCDGNDAGALRGAGDDLGGGGRPARVDHPVRDSAGALYGLEECLCAATDVGYAYYHCQRQCRAVNISKATLEGAFVDELALLQPTPAYMRLVKDRILCVW